MPPAHNIQNPNEEMRMRLRSGTLPTQVTRIPGLRTDPQLQSVPVPVKNIRTRVMSTLLTTGMQFAPDDAFLHEVLAEYAQLMFRLYTSLTWLNTSMVERMAIAANLDRQFNCVTRSWAMRSDVTFEDADLLEEIRKFDAYMVMFLNGGFYTPTVPEHGIDYLRVQCAILLPAVGGTVDLLLNRRQNTNVPTSFAVNCSLGPRLDPSLDQPTTPKVAFRPLINHQAMVQALGMPEQAILAARAQAAAAALTHAPSNGAARPALLPPSPEGEGGVDDAGRTSDDTGSQILADDVFTDEDEDGVVDGEDADGEAADGEAEDDTDYADEDEGSATAEEEGSAPAAPSPSPFPPGMRLGAVPPPPNLLGNAPPPPGDSF